MARQTKHRRIAPRSRFMPSTGRWAHTYAALDLGTHNCRLLVARPSRSGIRVIDAFSRIVRLGEGVGSSGRLSEAAQRRAIEAIQVCVEKMDRRGVNRYRAIATQACRLASNRDQFVDRVMSETGVLLDVIDAREEARLAIKGCVPLLCPGSDYAIIFDIGGGSTQVVLVHCKSGSTTIVDSMSIPYGVVTLGEQIGTDALDEQVYGRWVETIREVLEAFCLRNKLAAKVADGRVQMLGTSGTVTTLSGIDRSLPRYIRSEVDGSYLAFDAAREISHRLRRMSLGQRADEPCIGKDRADLVLAGCIILEAICSVWPVGRLRVADRGIREGILQDLMKAADVESATWGQMNGERC
ncbi:Ppx/GppA phosphatase family protein [Aestuariispira ectoiniformans]|uniref:Ppx/GppA phosphatase family protein n=1 Tax=Aestuariispira ectoiniformans TaxID=2775080 RepID=UPI00223B921B|nr:Ppx/GppA phosphatase family protein [Aestuariispira ectoiniformans]